MNNHTLLTIRRSKQINFLIQIQHLQKLHPKRKGAMVYDYIHNSEFLPAQFQLQTILSPLTSLPNYKNSGWDIPNQDRRKNHIIHGIMNELVCYILTIMQAKLPDHFCPTIGTSKKVQIPRQQ